MFKVAAVALVISVLYVLLWVHKREFTILLQLGAVVVILILILPDVKQLLDTFQNLIDISSVKTEYVAILAKALGISLITELAHDTCIDCGESALANKVELAGKTVVLTLSLPLLISVARFALELIGK
ncbi:MAG TPA: SpoIIIAC/SpoIIIAD family protein [Clostridiales bacterium]|nr:SpoIIIAC/SpoIIIAD family protein [Clostridiales bacterium]HXK83156.1 SpoIIIAC/SpoIIIAD family protein [Clostridiales bacterium]